MQPLHIDTCNSLENFSIRVLDILQAGYSLIDLDPENVFHCVVFKMRLNVEFVLVDVPIFLSESFFFSFVIVGTVFLFRYQDHSVFLSKEVCAELLLLLLDEVLLNYNAA